MSTCAGRSVGRAQVQGQAHGAGAGIDDGRDALDLGLEGGLGRVGEDQDALAGLDLPRHGFGQVHAHPQGREVGQGVERLGQGDLLALDDLPLGDLAAEGRPQEGLLEGDARQVALGLGEIVGVAVDASLVMDSCASRILLALVEHPEGLLPGRLSRLTGGKTSSGREVGHWREVMRRLEGVDVVPAGLWRLTSAGWGVL